MENAPDRGESEENSGSSGGCLTLESGSNRKQKSGLVQNAQIAKAVNTIRLKK